MCFILFLKPFYLFINFQYVLKLSKKRKNNYGKMGIFRNFRVFSKSNRAFLGMLPISKIKHHRGIKYSKKYIIY